MRHHPDFGILVNLLSLNSPFKKLLDFPFEKNIKNDGEQPFSEVSGP